MACITTSFPLNSQVQLNPAHSSDPILTSLSHLLVFFHRWTRVVISPIDFYSLSRYNSSRCSVHNAIALGWLRLCTLFNTMKCTYLVALIVLGTPYNLCAAGISLQTIEFSCMSSILQCKMIHISNWKLLTKYFFLFVYISHFGVPSNCHLTLCVRITLFQSTMIHGHM